MQRVAIYARLSRNRNGESTSLERQVAACRQRLDPDWREVAVYQDDDLSAYRQDVVRPGFDQMLSDASDGKADVILAYALDRLLRRDRDLSRLLDADVRFVTIRDGLDTASPTGQLVTKIMAAIAQNESDTIGARIRMKHDELRSQGRWSGGRRAFGLNDNWSAVIAEEAALINEAGERLLAGASMGSIVAQWNRRGVLTRTGKRWDLSSLRRMLLSPRMVGRRQVNGGLSEPGTPPIMDEATWHQLRALLSDPVRNQAGNRTKYLLAGMLECGRCGARMHTHSDRRRRRYQCMAVRDGCGKVSINAVPTELAVANAWLDYTNGPEFQSFTAQAQANRESRLADVERLRRDLRAALDRRNTLIDLWANGELSQEEWRRGREALDRQIEDMESALAQAESDAADVSWWGYRGLAATVWEHVGTPDQRRLLQTVMEKVVIHPASGRGRRFDATRIEPIFKPADGLHPGEFMTVQWNGQ